MQPTSRSRLSFESCCKCSENSSVAVQFTALGTLVGQVHERFVAALSRLEVSDDALRRPKDPQMQVVNGVADLTLPNAYDVFIAFSALFTSQTFHPTKVLKSSMREQGDARLLREQHCPGHILFSRGLACFPEGWIVSAVGSVSVLLEFTEPILTRIAPTF